MRSRTHPGNRQTEGTSNIRLHGSKVYLTAGHRDKGELPAVPLSTHCRQKASVSSITETLSLLRLEVTGLHKTLACSKWQYFRDRSVIARWRLCRGDRGGGSVGCWSDGNNERAPRNIGVSPGFWHGGRVIMDQLTLVATCTSRAYPCHCDVNRASTPVLVPTQPRTDHSSSSSSPLSYLQAS